MVLPLEVSLFLWAHKRPEILVGLPELDGVRLEAEHGNPELRLTTFQVHLEGLISNGGRTRMVTITTLD
jgi:hypothetical protein